MIYSPTICLANRRSRNRLSGPLMDRIDFHVAARYSDPAAFFIASTASSTVSRGVVLTALQAPPAAKAMNLPRFDGHGNSKKERGPDGSKKERATGLYGAIQKPSSGDG